MLDKGFMVPALAEPELPVAPSWFPIPPGWFFLGGSLLAVIVVFIIVRLAKWRRNVWRREALHALSQPQTVDSWLLLMKRTLLVHHPREAIAAQTAPEQWLEKIPLDPALRDVLNQRYCQRDNQLDDAFTTILREQLRVWIKGLPDV